MMIEFSKQELADMRRFLDQLALGGNQLPPEEDTNWSQMFLLLRKLLAYGVHNAMQTNPAIPYPDLQKKSQKPDAMWETLRVHFDDFDQLLRDCVAWHLKTP